MGQEKIYVLWLENGFYYVGASSDPSRRYDEHLQGAVAWTTKHRPLCLTVCGPVQGPMDEDNKTLHMMASYGIDRVRGGSFTAISLSESTLCLLQRMIAHATKSCFRCKNSSHLYHDCAAISPILVMQYHILHPPRKPPAIRCSRCGRLCHYSESCSFFLE